MSFNNKVGVSTHGYNLHSPDWVKVVWGDGENMGRAPMAVYMALKHNASMLAFGTGASRTEFGEFEADFTLRFLLEHFRELELFPLFCEEIFTTLTLKKAEDIIRKISITETESINSKTEVEKVMEIFAKNGMEHLCMISNPSHCPRLSWLASSINKERGNRFILNIVPCHTDFAADGESPVIFEPHPGPSPKPAVHPNIVFSDFFNVPPEKRVECLLIIKKVIKDYTQ